MSQILGIDFGGTNCVLMTVKEGHTKCVLNGESKRQTPAVVVMGTEERLIGCNGRTAWNRNYKSAISELKRWVGMTTDDPLYKYEKKFLSLPDAAFIEDPETKKVQFEVNYLGNKTRISPELAYGMMVGSLVDLAAKDAKRDVKTARDKFHVVLSVPPYFTNAQRQAILDGCQIARIQVLRLINDNTAALLKYAFKEQRELAEDKDAHVMVIDFGHSDYTVSIGACRPKSVSLVSQAWDKEFGGREVDMMLCEFFAKQCKESQGNPLESPKQLLKLIKGALKCKKVICSGVTDAICSVECLFPESNYPDFRGKISKKEFEDMCAPLLQRCIPPIEKALKDANLKAEDLHTVELIGGASRMPRFKEMILKYFEGKTKVTTTLNADEAIAEGCCLQAAILSPTMRCIPWSVQDVVSYPIHMKYDQDSSGAAESNSDDTSSSAMNTEGNTGGDAAVEEKEGSGEGVLCFDAGDSVPRTRRINFKRENEFNFWFTSGDSTLGKGKVANIPPVEQEALDAGKSKKRKLAINVRHDINGIVRVASVEYKKYVKKVVPVKTATTTDAGATDMKVEESKEPTTDANANAAPGDATTEAATEVKWKERRQEMAFEFSLTNGLNEKTMTDLIQTELEMCKNDWNKQAKDEARNNCESMCYQIKEYFEEDGELEKFETEENRQAACAFAEETEDWLYDDDSDDFTIKDYENKTAELQSKVQGAQDRLREHKERPQAQSMLISKIEEYRRVANSTMLIYEHLTADERENIRKKCSEVQDWVYGKTEEQGNLPLHAEPILTAQTIRDKRAELVKHCHPIANRPKPVKKKEEEEKAPTPTTTNTENTTTQGEDQKMDEEKAKDTSTEKTTPPQGNTTEDGKPEDTMEVEQGKTEETTSS
eukprot:g2100.t1